MDTTYELSKAEMTNVFQHDTQFCFMLHSVDVGWGREREDIKQERKILID